jgi:RNA polymerase-interacting CarD/CdnL/TRCF family regulator
MSRNPLIRRKQLSERMQKKTLEDICMIIRDLTKRSYGRRLNSNDMNVLKRAETLLLDEWVLSLGTPRERAQHEMMWLLREKSIG